MDRIDETDEMLATNRGEPICNIAQSMYDDFIKANAEFRVRSGLNATITRTSVGHCCEWCARLAGTYNYGEEPDEVYHRHDRCKCAVTYKCDKVIQNVHTKKWLNDQERKKLETRKTIGRSNVSISPQKRMIIAAEAEKGKSKNNKLRVDFKLVNSKSYRDKFRNITKDDKLNELLRDKGINILEHRNGTLYEDLHIINSKTGKVIATQAHSKIPEYVTVNDSIIRAIKKYSEDGNLIGIHNHPRSLPPSGGDFAAAIKRGYSKGVIVCHDGSVYVYTTGNKKMTGRLYDMTVEKYEKKGYNTLQAYQKALEELKGQFGILWRKI